VGLHDRGEGWVYAKEGEILSVVEGREEEIYKFIKEQLRKRYISDL